jgi:hypothetical protein
MPYEKYSTVFKMKENDTSKKLTTTGKGKKERQNMSINIKENSFLFLRHMRFYDAKPMIRQ